MLGLEYSKHFLEPNKNKEECELEAHFNLLNKLRLLFIEENVRIKIKCIVVVKALGHR